MIDSSPKAIEKRARRIHGQAAGVRQGLAVVFVCAGVWAASTVYDVTVTAEVERRIDALRAELGVALTVVSALDAMTGGERVAKAEAWLKGETRRTLESATPRWRYLVGGALLGLALGLSIGIPLAAALQLYALRALADLNRHAAESAVAAARRDRERRTEVFGPAG